MKDFVRLLRHLGPYRKDMVIGCLMADPGTVPETMGIVREEDFQSRILRSIFRACRELGIRSSSGRLRRNF